MRPLFRYLFPSLLLCLLASGSFAQSLESEQAKLARLERQNENLIALNADIQSNLSNINNEIRRVEAQSPASTKLNNATEALAAARATNKATPSVINKDKLDMAQFKHALALRKHNKGNPALAPLKKEQQELNKAITANTQKITDNKASIISQLKLIKNLRAEKQNARQTWLLKQEQQKTQQDDNLLQKAEQERSDALAEVGRLRTLLANQQSQQQAAEQLRLKADKQLAPQPAQNTATANPATEEFESFVFLANSEEITAEKNRIRTALASSNDKAGSKFSQFISIKTYNNGTIVARKTKRLDHIGGAIYQNTRVTIPVNETVFVVGQDKWRINLPELDDGVLEGQATSYTVTLDLRNRDLPFLTIYPD